MRRDKKVLLAAMLGATVMAAPAVSIAQARGETGWYLGASIGQSQFKDACNGFVGVGVSCDDKDTTFKIRAAIRSTATSLRSSATST